MRLCVTDAPSFPQRVLWDYKVYYNAYSGNESPNCFSGRHGHLYRTIASYRRVTKAGQTTPLLQESTPSDTFYHDFRNHLVLF